MIFLRIIGTFLGTGLVTCALWLDIHPLTIIATVWVGIWMLANLDSISEAIDD